MNNEVSYVPHSEIIKWSPQARIGAGTLSLATLYLSRNMKGISRDVTRFLAISLGLRALFNKDLTQFMGTLISPTVRLRREIVVNAPAEEAAQFWSTLENYRLFMSFVHNVTTSSRGNMMWEISGPGGVPLRWEATITSWWPSYRVSWVTVPGSPIYNSGRVVIQPMDYDHCKVWVELTYALRAGALGQVMARVIGFDPRDHIDRDLSIMKKLIEDEWRKKQQQEIVPLTS